MTEVTDDMIIAGMREWDRQHRAGQRQWPWMLRAVYLAMAKAANGTDMEPKTREQSAILGTEDDAKA